MYSVNFQNTNDNKSLPDMDNLLVGLHNNPYFQEMHKNSVPSEMKLVDSVSSHRLNYTSASIPYKPSDFSASYDTNSHNIPVLTESNNATDSINNSSTSAVELDFPEPTKLRISTMTAICSSDFTVDLELLYTNIEFDNIDTSIPYIQSCQYGSRPIKGLDVKVKKKRAKSKKKKDCFQNQATVIVNLAQGNRVNLKIFRNGKLQMTGLKSNEGGVTACKTLINTLQQLHTINPNIVTFHSENPIPDNFNIVLINSDFSVGFKIKRDELYHILFQKNIFVSYEPDIYPGVNAKYYYNSFNNYSGICNCTSPCDGKGDGNGNGCCKKVTIATFQSGNIIITGARNDKQTEAAYLFINELFKNHYHEILRVTSHDATSNQITGSTKVQIKITDIINYAEREKILKALSKKK